MQGRIYVVVPKTVDSSLPPYKLSMSCGRMAAHVAHAAGLLQETFSSTVDVKDTDLIVLSVANSRELQDTLDKVNQCGIWHVCYRDTDKAFEGELLTAIATIHLDEEQRKVFKGLSPWKCKCNEV